MHRRHARDLARVAVLTLAVAGCGGGSGDGLPRKSISGTVKLDGTPLPKGMISFDPTDPGAPGAVSAGAIIVEGSYSIAAAQGPTPGKYRVSIRSTSNDSAATQKAAPGMPPKKAAKDAVPEKYNTQSKLSADITADQSAPFDFELSSK